MKILRARILAAAAAGATLFGLACTTPEMAHHRALESERAGDYVEAARRDLQALDRRPDFEPARQHLERMAPLAAVELVRRAEAFERARQWLEAMSVYDDLASLRDRTARHGIALDTIDVEARRTAIRARGAADTYRRAERFFEAGSYRDAIRLYEQTHALSPYYEHTIERLWASYIGLGDQALDHDDPRRAVKAYEEALHHTRDPEVTRRRLAEAHYVWAEQREDDRDWQEAAEHYAEADLQAPGYADAVDRALSAYEAAVVRVAVLPFAAGDVESRRAARRFTSRLRETLLDTYESSRTLEVLTAPEVRRLLRLEPRLREDPPLHLARAMWREEGVSHYVTGKLESIEVESESPRVETKSRTVTRSDGTSETIHYKVYDATRTVRVTLRTRLLDAPRSRVAVDDRDTVTMEDEAHWVRYAGPPEDLPSWDREGLEAAAGPMPAEQLLRKALAKLVDASREALEDHLPEPRFSDRFWEWMHERERQRDRAGRSR